MKSFARHLIAVGTCAACIFLPLPAHAIKPRVKQIIVVLKIHFDIGDTDPATNVLTGCRTKFADGAMDVIGQSQNLPPDERFVWTETQQETKR